MFIEKQSFREKFLGTYLSFIALTVFVFLVFPEWSKVSVPALGVLGFLVSLLYFAELHTRVEYDGIHIQFFPIHLSEKLIEWEDIKEFEAEEYNPLLEFGGWGIRWRPQKIAYNVRGNHGVRITKENGKQVLIGSERADELESAIKKEKEKAD